MQRVKILLIYWKKNPREEKQTPQNLIVLTDVLV